MAFSPVLAIGGASSTLPAMQQALVLHHHFITSAEFVRLFGLAQAAPGPNVLVVTLLGWRIAGLPGSVYPQHFYGSLSFATIVCLGIYVLLAIGTYTINSG